MCQETTTRQMSLTQSKATHGLQPSQKHSLPGGRLELPLKIIYTIHKRQEYF